MEEYVKLNIESYDDLKTNSYILEKIHKCITIENFDRNGNIIDDNWCSNERIRTTDLNLDLSEILKILGYNVKDYDRIVSSKIYGTT